MKRENWLPELDFELIDSLVKVKKKRQNLKKKCKNKLRKLHFLAFGEARI
jgi:hypothetical protein